MVATADMNPAVDPAELRRARRKATYEVAASEGLLGVKDDSIGGRVPCKLLAVAKMRAGTDNVSELLLYALTKVALEDDFGPRLVARKGRVPRGTLEA